MIDFEVIHLFTKSTERQLLVIFAIARRHFLATTVRRERFASYHAKKIAIRIMVKYQRALPE